jgi:hypothetical protein
MAAPVWKDISSYSQSDKERIPKTFKCTISKYSLLVTRHRDYPGQWLLRCDGMFYEIPIEDCSAQAARAQAFTLFKQHALELIKELEEAIKEL